MDKIFSFRWN